MAILNGFDFAFGYPPFYSRSAQRKNGKNAVNKNASLNRPKASLKVFQVEFAPDTRFMLDDR